MEQTENRLFLQSLPMTLSINIVIFQKDLTSVALKNTVCQ